MLNFWSSLPTYRYILYVKKIENSILNTLANRQELQFVFLDKYDQIEKKLTNMYLIFIMIIQRYVVTKITLNM